MTWEVALCIIAAGIAIVPVGGVIYWILKGVEDIFLQKRFKAEEERKKVEAEIELTKERRYERQGHPADRLFGR